MKINMTSVKQKVKSLTELKVLQSKNNIKDIYKALEVLLDKNYNKYEFDDTIDIENITGITDENFQTSLFKVNEKSKKQKNNGVYYTSDDVARYIICNARSKCYWFKNKPNPRIVKIKL